MSSFQDFIEQTRIGRMSSTRTIMFHHAIAERLGLHSTDHKCLLFLADGPKTPSELARATGLSSGALTTVIDRLERVGFVERQPDLSDRRKILVHAQPKAWKMIMPLFAHLAAAMRDLEKQYTPEQIDLIVGFMERANEILYQETLRLRQEQSH